MTVRNEEKKAFRDLTAQERSEIVENLIGGGVEWLDFSGSWTEYKFGSVGFCRIYRTKQRKLEIPWHVIKHEYKWAAMDDNGDVWFSTFQPSIRLDNGSWRQNISSCQSPLNIDTTGIDWRESLTERPEGV